MDRMTAQLLLAYRKLEPKWRYAAETLAELLSLLLLVAAGALGFVPWLLWQGGRWIICRMRKAGESGGSVEDTENEISGHSQ